MVRYFVMKTPKTIWFTLLGITLGIGAQYIGLQTMNVLPLEIQQSDPAGDLLYSSIGFAISVLFGLYFALGKQWALIVGIVLGTLLWWPFVGLLMMLTGTWL